MLEITRFKSVKNTKPVEVSNLLTIIEEIRSDKYKTIIEEIRQDENPSKSPKKDKLPVFTPTGRFNYRSIAGLEEYNGVICLDIDNVEDVISLKARAEKLNYVHATFITPSGKGLKVVIKSKATPETYKQVEIEIAEAFSHDTGGIRDNHCKDIARIQFVSYDPTAYINENSRIF